MKRLALAFCTLSILAATAPAFAECMSQAASTPTNTTTTASTAPTNTSAPKGG